MDGLLLLLSLNLTSYFIIFFVYGGHLFLSWRDLSADL